jgi:hypothetical protein
MDNLTEHYARLLGLGDNWEVTEVDLDLPSLKVTIHLQRVAGSVCSCPGCGEPRPLKDHAAERQWRHLDTMQFETVLVARTPRTNCLECGVLNVDLPWAGLHDRYTLMFQAFAIRVLQASASIEQARQLLGLSWHATQDIMSAAVKRGLLDRDTDGLAYVGIDERSFGRRHDYVSVLTDIEGSRVLEVAEGRTREAADTLWNTLGTFNGIVGLWDLETGNRIINFEGHRDSKENSRYVLEVAVSPDANVVASAGTDGHVKLWPRTSKAKVWGSPSIPRSHRCRFLRPMQPECFRCFN